MNHPLLPFVRQKVTSLNQMASYGFLALSAYVAFKKQPPESGLAARLRAEGSLREQIALKSNPVKITDGILKNFRPLFKWFIDKEIQDQDWADRIITHWAARTHHPDQLDVMLKLARAREYYFVFKEGYSKFYGMDIPMQLRWEAYKKLSEYVIKNFAVQHYTELWREYSVDIEKFKKEFNSITRIFQSIHESNLRNMEERLHHYADLMHTNEDFKDLKKVKWSEPIKELVEILREKHDEINVYISKRGIKSKPEPHEEFITVHKNLKWFLVSDRFCPYEQEGMGHCATAPQGCLLVSLREFSNKGNFDNTFEKTIWVPRVTATVCPTDDGRYYVTEILGPENEAPDKKWEGAIYKLYLHPKIEAYRDKSRKSHKPEILSPKKREKVYEQKPSMAPISKRLKSVPDSELHKEFLEHIRDYSRSAYGLIDTVIKYKGDGHILLYEHENAKSLFNVVDFFVTRDEREELGAAVEAYEEPYIWSDHNDFWTSWKYIEIDDYLSALSTKALKKHFGTTDVNEIDKDDVPEEIREIMQQADSDMQRSGTESGLSSYAFSVLKDVSFQDYDGRDTAFVDFNDGKWQFWILAKSLRQSMIAAIDDDRDVVDYVLSHFHIHSRDNWRYESDYDSQFGVERFLELFEEKYGEK